MQALSVKGLCLDFGGLRALWDVSFDIHIGERVAIIGPNGAGKTTLFNVLNGQLKATAGRVSLFGQDITRLTTYERVHLGMSRSFQLTTLFLNLTVLDNTLLAFQGILPSRFQLLKPLSSYRSLYHKARELLGSMALWEKRNEPVTTISYGEQRKLEIALALASRPKLLLLDEPNCGLTASENTEMIAQLRKLGTEITVILVAHDMDLVFGFAEKIIVFHYGKIISQGTCDEIRRDERVKEVYMRSQETSG
ncbi:MAG: hypothetical protein A2170_16690 [Deltaproteobacteria bacterium RBG_13_53_10]|nr:MAG: hypothetical protein A2170_16690 [Deltaproteobacteria bacterium RBG_13_53_10]